MAVRVKLLGLKDGVNVGMAVGIADGTTTAAVPIMQLYCFDVLLTVNPGTVGQSRQAV